MAALSLLGGLPFGFFFETLPAYMRQANLSLTVIGLAGLAQLPWIVKPLWAPLVDRRATPARWLQLAALGMAAALLALAGQADRPGLWPLLACLTAFCAAAATQDLVVDAYFVRVSQGQPADAVAALSAWRMAAYKLALHGGSGACLVLGHLVGFAGCFAALAATLGLGGLALAPWLRPPVVAAGAAPTSPSAPAAAAARSGGEDPADAGAGPAATGPDASFAAALWAWLRLPAMPGAIGYVLSYKLALGLLGPMGKPFWLDLGASPLRLGSYAGAVGLGGALLGIGLARGLVVRGSLGWALVCGSGLEAATAAAYLGAHALGSAAWMGPALAVEGMAQGCTTTLLVTVLARLCQPAQAATQFAVLSAGFGLTRVLGGLVGGAAAAHLGWTGFLAAIPCASLVSLAFLPPLLRRLATPPAPPP